MAVLTQLAVRRARPDGDRPPPSLARLLPPVCPQIDTSLIHMLTLSDANSSLFCSPCQATQESHTTVPATAEEQEWQAMRMDDRSGDRGDTLHVQGGTSRQLLRLTKARSLSADRLRED